jgi:chromosome segregation ATPase
MDFEPKQLVFRDVRLNQSYTTSLCITNPLNSPVEFTIRSSNSSRYSISPNQVQLQPKQSIVVTIRLFLNHYPVHHLSKGIHHHHGQEDSLHIKSVYFDQKLTIQFFLHSSMMRSSSPLSRSTSPSGSRVRFSRNTAVTADTINSSDNNMMMIINDLKQQILDRDNRIVELQNTITALESKHPKWTEIIRSKVKQEREVFEERSGRIMAILQLKDENILALEKKLEESMKQQQQQQVRNRSRSSSAASSSSSSSTYSVDADMTTTTATTTHRDKIHEQEAIISKQRKEIDDLLLLQRQQQVISAGDDQSAASIALRNDLVRAKDAIKTLQDKLSITSKELSQYKSTSSSSSKLIPAVQLQELRGLREQTIDQSEQIEALVMELKKMRSEARDYGNLSDELTQARREVQRLREDATHRQQQHEQQQAYATELQVSKSELERSYASLRSQCDQQQSEINQLLLLRSSGINETINARPSTSDTHTTPLRRGVSFQGQQQQQLSGQQPQQAATNSVTEQLLSSRIGPSSNPPPPPPSSVDRTGQLYMDGVAYESNIGGGDDDGEAVASGSSSTGNIATSTPMNYSFRNGSSLKDFKVNEYNSELLNLYQDQLTRYEGEVAELKTRLEDTVGAERELRGQTSTLDDRLRALEQESRVLTDRLERTKSERDHMSTELQAKEMELQDALQRIEQQVRSNDKDEAQVWWSYIWHALREQQGHAAVQQVGVDSDMKEATGGRSRSPDSGGGGGNNNYPGSYDYQPPHETAQKAHDQRLRENLRSQAIEIATLRQVK